jgi:hypothetical protein
MLAAGGEQQPRQGRGSEGRGEDGECEQQKVFVLVVSDDVHGKLPSITTQNGGLIK